ncbi:hypothetical protein KY330_04715 [Candidatus Woesearchaeota archaeon]|nr:hypothetical protein [Candidatus Woesearchaeota archaeon]
MKRLIIFSIVFLAIAGFVYSQPQFPIQVYGSLTQGGVNVPDGVSVKLMKASTILATVYVKDGKYGYDPILFIDGTSITQGEIIDIYVNNQKATSTQYLGSSDLQINVDVSSSIDVGLGTPSTAPSLQPSTGSGPINRCYPYWDCTAWSSCVDGKQTRTCIDKNRCNLPETMPALERTCSIYVPPTEQPQQQVQQPSQVIGTGQQAGSVLGQQQGQGAAQQAVTEQPGIGVTDLALPKKGIGLGWWILIIIVLGIVGTFAYGYVLQLKHLPKQQPNRFVHQALHAGYTQHEIKKSLSEHNWAGNVIDQALNVELLRYRIEKLLRSGMKKAKVRKELLEEGLDPEIVHQLLP